LVERNQIIECVVLNINKEEKKISLGVKQLENDPWDNLLDRYPIDSKHTGKVRNLTNFGVFVELEPGIDGLVHISDLSWTDKINHPGDVVDKGQDLEVIILAVDFDNRRITLGHKQVETNPWETYLKEFAKATETTGKVSKITDKGIFVDLGKGAEAFMHKNEAEFEGDDFKEAFSEGDEIKVVVTECDESSKSIEVSQKKIGKVQKGGSGKSSGGSSSKGSSKKKKSSSTPDALTLGEVSGLADLKGQLEEKERAEAAAAKEAEEADATSSDDADEESDDEEKK
jgi:small subunit ribosomal protein S1